MKKVLIGVGVLVLVIAGALFYVWGNLDKLVKDAIQTYGSEATKTAVRVDSVKLELKDGRATIKGLRVANPAGFSDPYIFKLGMISTRIDTASISKNPIIIDEIRIQAPSVVYEIDKSGVSNVDRLKKNLGVGGGKTGRSASGGKQLKFIIRKLVVDGSSAKVRIAALNQEKDVTLPRIVLTDVGQKSGGETALEVARELSARMAANVQGAVAKNGLDKYLGKSATDLRSQMQKQLGGQAGQFGNALKGMLGK